MNERDILFGKINELALFLGANGVPVWADRLRELIAVQKSQGSVQQLRTEIRQMFGAMGSLTDIDIYFEDAKRTKVANARLNKLLDELFDLVNAE
jgi:hypothetical protein